MLERGTVRIEIFIQEGVSQEDLGIYQELCVSNALCRRWEGSRLESTIRSQENIFPVEVTQGESKAGMGDRDKKGIILGGKAKVSSEKVSTAEYLGVFIHDALQELEDTVEGLWD